MEYTFNQLSQFVDEICKSQLRLEESVNEVLKKSSAPADKYITPEEFIQIHKISRSTHNRYIRKEIKNHVIQAGKDRKILIDWKAAMKALGN